MPGLSVVINKFSFSTVDEARAIAQDAVNAAVSEQISLDEVKHANDTLSITLNITGSKNNVNLLLLGLRKELGINKVLVMSEFPEITGPQNSYSLMHMGFMDPPAFNLEKSDSKIILPPHPLEINFKTDPGMASLPKETQKIFAKIFAALPLIIKQIDNKDANLHEEQNLYDGVHLRLQNSFLHGFKTKHYSDNISYDREKEQFSVLIKKEEQNPGLLTRLTKKLENLLLKDSSFDRASIKAHILADPKSSDMFYSEIKLSLKAAKTLTKSKKAFMTLTDKIVRSIPIPKNKGVEVL